MILSAGKDYKTRGGWKARCIFITTTKKHGDGTIYSHPVALVVHYPETLDEQAPVNHKLDGMYLSPLFHVGTSDPDVNVAFDRPADIIAEWQPGVDA